MKSLDLKFKTLALLKEVINSMILDLLGLYYAMHRKCIPAGGIVSAFYTIDNHMLKVSVTACKSDLWISYASRITEVTKLIVITDRN